MSESRLHGHHDKSLRLSRGERYGHAKGVPGGGAELGAPAVPRRANWSRVAAAWASVSSGSQTATRPISSLVGPCTRSVWLSNVTRKGPSTNRSRRGVHLGDPLRKVLIGRTGEAEQWALGLVGGVPQENRGTVSSRGRCMCEHKHAGVSRSVHRPPQDSSSLGVNAASTRSSATCGSSCAG